MTCADNYHEVLLYLEQAETDIDESFEKNVASKKHYDFKRSNELPKIEEENTISIRDSSLAHFCVDDSKSQASDLEDIKFNLQMLLKLNEAIRSDLSELLAHHDDVNDDVLNLSDYRFCRTVNRRDRHRRDDYELDDDEKGFTEIDMLSDLESQSEISTTITSHAATQTSPSPSESSTNLTWASSSPGSDTESSESDLWRNASPISYRSSRRVLASGKSNSTPVLKKLSPSLGVSRQSRSQSDRHLAEIEAAEACKWLRATGFPQYAQMYEDMQFPIDISQAAQDHPLLDSDVLHSLFRRLQILNSCAHLHQQRVTHTDESDDEHCALSENWTYQRDVRRWSRTCTGPINIEDISKRLEISSLSSQDKDDVFEKCTQSPKERLRRAGSSKFRRRKDGACLSERDATLESVSPIGSLKTLQLNHISDTEITPHHHSRVRTKSLDKSEGWVAPPAVDRVIWHKVASETEAGQFNVSDEATEESGVEICLHNVSATQFQILKKLALLKLTAQMEKHCPSHRTGRNWDLPKLIRKIKGPAYKDKNVFGVPLTITLQRTGQVLPRNIEEALHWLQQNAADHVGIFRKPGVKSRIQALRNVVETSNCVDYSTQQSYDVADMIKQYFRDLPERLLTNKMSETFILIFQYIQPQLLRESVLWALLLMPDEHLEVVEALLYFLLTISKQSGVNQMNESNLAMCFAPSLFHYSQVYKQNVGSPHPKELAENKAGYDCLHFLLTNFNNLFKIPQHFIKQCKSNEIKVTKAKLLNDLGSERGGWREYLGECQANLLKEVKEKQRGWYSVPSHHARVEVSYKKVADGIPLRLWKVSAEIDAPPLEVLHRILRERYVWDPNLRSAKTVVQLDCRSEVFQFVRASIPPRPSEEYCVVRTWRTDLSKDGCLLVETSVEYPEALPAPNSCRGLVLASRYLVEPCGSGRSKLVHLSRVDTMGRSPEWYQKHYGHLQALYLVNIQNSFSGHQNTMGPESKV
ncbi:rho GTPase-activating protein 7 [Anthonomus grandis grandis]|uniref:rho GTPase-activating protein 7 n=1 Tax=Anthonomus grandis grandis TaxID=2921223 RepID=UPI002165CD80|nr:rho GTPase-activating protein 7 [Anthonomus grandis grandis]